LELEFFVLFGQVFIFSFDSDDSPLLQLISLCILANFILVILFINVHHRNP
jgi:hypothetical protein